jgi:hypothetical protein
MARASARFPLAAALLALTISAGCHHYVPVPMESVTPGSDIRARVTAEEARRLEPILVRDDARVLEGIFLERRNGNILVQVPVVSELRGIRMETIHQRVDLPVSSILEMELKEIDRGRTGLALGAGTVILVALVVNHLRDSGSSDRDGPLPPPDEIRVPLRIFLSR